MLSMKTKHYVAFLQTTRTQSMRVTSSAKTHVGEVIAPARIVDRIILMVEATHPADARAKLNELFETTRRTDPQLQDITSVSSFEMVEIPSVPACGLVLHHEAIFDLASVSFPLDPQRGAGQVEDKETLSIKG